MAPPVEYEVLAFWSLLFPPLAVYLMEEKFGVLCFYSVLFTSAGWFPGTLLAWVLMVGYAYDESNETQQTQHPVQSNNNAIASLAKGLKDGIDLEKQVSAIEQQIEVQQPEPVYSPDF